MTQTKILLIGCDGQVGWELRRTLAPLGELASASLCGRWGLKLDLGEAASIEAAIRQVRPRLIVNAAAYTAVDRAEGDAETAQRVNGDALGLIGRLALELEASVVHYSTDYVFRGDANAPYREEDPTAPLGVYGRTKLEGERQLLDSGADAVILRTAWVYGGRGHNFLLTMKRLCSERPELSVVHDQIGAPTWSRMLAEATALMLAQTRPDGFRFGQRAGLYHLTNGGQTSWHGFASAIRDLLGASCTIHPIPTSDYPTPARRPAYSVLDNRKIEQAFGIRLPDWRTALDLCTEGMIV
jgi:dTDP-4-dehydrorhamnose reductase